MNGNNNYAGRRQMDKRIAFWKMERIPQNGGTGVSRFSYLKIECSKIGKTI